MNWRPDMKRLTVEKLTKDMNMIELALNSCYGAEDDWAMYRDYDHPEGIDARKVARVLLETLTQEEPPDIDDQGTFEDYMTDLLSMPLDSIEGVVALLYRNLWAMAELRERLKAYEDTGLEPEEIKRLFCTAQFMGVRVDPERGREIIQAEKEGRLVVLPCKVGDDVFFLYEAQIYRLRVQGISVAINGEPILHCGGYPASYVWGNELGRSFFLTREAAEASLAERERGSDK